MQLLCKIGFFVVSYFPFFFAPMYYITPKGLQLLDNQQNTAGVMSRGNVSRLPPLPLPRYEVA